MKTKQNPPLTKDKKNVKRRMKKSVIISFFGLVIALIFVGYTSNVLYYKNTYENLDIDFTSVKEIEYGTANYDPMSLVKNISDGKITNVTKVDTSKVGTKKLVFEITKDNVVKKISLKVKVKDSIAPTISLKEENVSINKGDQFDINSNIESVNDVVDGNLPLSDSEKKTSYIVSSNLDTNVPGEYDVNIKATDSNGNVSESSYKITVTAPAPAPVVQNIQNNTNQNVTYTTSPSSVDTSSVVSAAYSLIGSRYTYGGNSPETGFDCSGFVQYIYGAVGKSISRSSGTQLYDGSAVSKENLQPGDIIIWSTQSNNVPTHSSIYVGGGNIVHAINSSRGVQETSLSSWETYGGHIVGIRRV